MKISVMNNSVVVEIICILYIMLYVYAAVNKFIDFQNFQIQLAQSPLLTSFASLVSWAVPVTELVIALLLCIPRYRLIALYAAFALMVMFTAYIIIILNFSPFVPCSCGGILEKLNWTEHLIFNIVVAAFALPAILIETSNDQPAALKKSCFGLLIITVVSTIIMFALFFVSEDMFHHRNNFIRRFPLQPAEYLRDFTIPPKSYIAGAGNGKVFIGSANDPLKIIAIDQELKASQEYRISTNDPERRFRKMRVTVQYPNFFVSDGIEAFAFKGSVLDWKAKIWIDKLAYHNSFVPIDSQHVAIRAVYGDNNESMIGVMQQADKGSVIFNKNLLNKQIDGFFDTDGKLLYNKKHQKIVYVYLYRNEYVITDTQLKSKVIGNTIDTTSTAKIKVAYDNAAKDKKIASPMRTVNKTSATEGDFLFINSKLMGQMEPREMWDVSSIVDVYNIKTRAYLFSFYLYDKNGKKISEFTVADGKIYTVAGEVLSVYRINPYAFKNNN